MEQFGLEQFVIDADWRVAHNTIRREFLSTECGGNRQQLIATPRREKVAEHGYKQFLCPTLALHPMAPQVPGAPGLLFDCPAMAYDDPWEGRYCCFTGLVPGQWLHVGVYESKGHARLTVDEWLELPASVSMIVPHA